MAYEKMKYRGWCPSNDYEIHEITEPALRKRFDRPRHQKGHVAFKTNIEEEALPPSVPLPQSETLNTNPPKPFVSVDQKADAFIKQEHRRIELARLKSLGFV
ncbi:hypothetical protein VNO77_44081 [Canavalia gladiata]|uniref:Uncharacterized protein n=1 Tax=Canavalia gladiata TaxID=3824 RepID=A0AAN9JWD2_CANGL